MLSRQWWQHWGPNIGLWLLILAMLFLGMRSLLEQQEVPNRISSLSGRVLELQRARDGHYRLEGQINGQVVKLMLDTGATGVAMDMRLAQKLGLQPGRAIAISTANGEVEGYLTRIAELRLGDIILRDIPANMSPNFGDPDEVLLGMSALKHLAVTMQGDRMQISLPAQTQSPSE